MDAIERLEHAAETGDVAQVERLLREGVPADAKSTIGPARTALDRAIWAEQTDVVRLLLAGGADADQPIGEYGEDTPVRFAAPRGMTDIMRILLEAGADPDGRVHEKQDTPLERAALQGHVAIVKMLIEHGASIHYIEGRLTTPLSAAASGGWPIIVRLLLDHGAVPKLAALELAETMSVNHRSDAARRADYAEVINMIKTARALGA